MSDQPTLHDEIADIHSDAEDDRFSNPAEARKKAMDYLARREHSRAEILQKLQRFGFAPGISVEAVDRLAVDGLQSDQRYVEAFVQSRVNQGKGPVKIRAELGQRGIRDVVLDNVLASAGVDWFELARDTRAKKFGAELPVDYSEKARQMRFLQSRGFEQDQINFAVTASTI